MHKFSESPPAALQAAPPRQNPGPTRVLSHRADVHKHSVFPEGPSTIQRVSVQSSQRPGRAHLSVY